MQFINMLMLAGLAAVAIPVVIQILTRKNPRRIDWGAWMFLDRTMKKRRRKVLLEDILLLACRCLALGLLALAFARPFVRPDSPVPWSVTMPVLLAAMTAFGVSFALWRYPKQRRLLFYGGIALFALAISTIVFERWLNLKRFGLGANKDVVIVVDGSTSMALVNDGRSNFDRAVEEAKRYVELAPRNTSFAVIIGGPVPQVLTPVPIADRRVVMNALERVRPTNGTMQIAGSLTAAAVTLAAGHNAVKQIVIVGDGQTVGWQLDDRERWKTLERVFSSLKTRPIITWRTLPLPTSMRNLAVSGVRPSREVVGTDREVRLDVSVVNAGTEAVTPKGVSLEVEGETLRASGVRQLEPGEEQTFSFRHRFRAPGGAILTAKVEAEDDLPDDDVYRYAMPVAGSLGILVVDGDPGAAFMNRASTYVRLALRPQLPGQADEEGRPYLVNAVVEDVTAAGARASFAGFAAVVLAGVRHLPPKKLDALARFAESGGGILFMPSSATDAESFGAWARGGEKVLPAPPGKWRDSKSEVDTSSFREMLSRFRTGSDLSGASPVRVMEFGESYASNAVVLAKLADGTPFLLSRAFGRGTVMESAFPFDPSSGLVSKRSFLPFVHELAYALARPASVQLDVRPAEGLSLLLASGASGGTAVTEGGLVGYYFPAPRLNGRPKVRVDPRIDFSWGGGAPFKDFPADDFSVRWRGVITAPADGRYAFAWDVDDRLRLRIGGKAVQRNGTVEMKGSTPYPIEVVFEEDKGHAAARLKWKKPGGGWETVPADALRTRAPGVESAGEIVEVVDPHGETFYAEVLTTDAGLVLRIARSVIPGVYEVSGLPESVRDSVAGVAGADGRIRFSVSSGVEESTLSAITQKQLSDLCGYVQISQAIKEEDVVKAIGGQSFGKEVWRVLAFFAFLFLVAEPAIARWIAINRRTGDIIDTEGTWIRT
ncbi:MAG: BatA domain-containing protein [Kiritimatiellae bacterium]|nr:BatA domain-containing protein [Kiritimatiellia bacterium]